MTSPHTPKALVVVNSPSSGPRRLATWLEHAGVEVVAVHGADGLPETLDGFDGLVLLGGGLMPDDDERAPWLSVERDLVRQAIEQDLPTLGICLGAQVIAKVAGGEVQAKTGPKERGATAIHTTPAGREDRVIGAIGHSAHMIENHEDMITRLPESAVLLASSDAIENQAFVIGEHVRAVQFHPEASAADLQNWDDAALREEGLDIADLLTAARAVHGENTSASRQLIDAFAAEMGGSPRIVAAAARALDDAVVAAKTEVAPAVSVAIFDRTGVIAWRGLGEPRLDGDATARNTVFRIASMSKSFLAATALALSDEGRLDLNRDLDEYVPGVLFRWQGEARQVTVGELLANRSGMPEDNAYGDRALGANREEIAALGEHGFELTALPGEKYQYSNIGMSFVGRAIEAVTGNTVEAEVRSRFLVPLGLDSTRYDAGEYAPGHDLAHGFRTFDDGASFVPEPFVGSGALACIGALFSTVDDIAAWSAFLASGFSDAPLRPEVLSAHSRREMQRVHTVIPVGDAGPYRDLAALGYGYGLAVEHDRQHGRIAQHSGGLPGFSSHMRWQLATGIGAVAFGNSDVFRTERLAADALVRVLAAVDAPAEETRPWPATLHAAEALDAAIRHNTTFADTGVLATNVLLDTPEPVRRARIDALLADIGPISAGQPAFASRIRSADDAAHLRWSIACDRGELFCEVRLIGLAAPLVQSLSVTSAEASELDGRRPRVIIG
ncbi:MULTISPECIES: serine hydrolase [unclassified Leucobacter]|uniref:serine hydrolase n=1 Tax=unclassified Leucobacter TaxID=2621730 RepID=UPI00203E6FB8|nr:MULTISPECIES: serine hydrolase [unclassified Leucobacter]